MTIIDRTQCPACQTVYRVASDQLSLASGQVRCGACLQVFDAAVQGWSTEAKMHATEPALETNDWINPIMPEPVVAPEPKVELETRQQAGSRWPQLAVVRTYARWWLLGAGIGALLLTMVGWLLF